ncbi:hypothetical protein ES707_22594 [subsurface metagenome]
MKSIKKYLIMTLVMWGFVFAVPFLTNGNFEEPLTTGWFQTTSGGNTAILRNTNYDPDPDYEAYVYKGSGDGFTKLHQTVDIPTTDLEFSVNAKLYASSTSSTCWAGAAVVISYLNDSDFLLGKTMLCARSYACPWIDTDTRHIIAVTDSLWHNYVFNVDNELVNLNGVNPSDIKKIQVALFGQATSG